jgi:hypothetical protein
MAPRRFQNNGKQVCPLQELDVGTIWKPFPRLIVNSALWYLYLQQVCLCGWCRIIELAETKRGGWFRLRYQLNDYYFTDGRKLHLREKHWWTLGQNYIPLAPDFTSTRIFKFSMWTSQITIPLLKVVLQMKIILVAKGYIVIFILIMNIKVSLFGYQLRIIEY